MMHGWGGRQERVRGRARPPAATTTSPSRSTATPSSTSPPAASGARAARPTRARAPACDSRLDPPRRTTATRRRDTQHLLGLLVDQRVTPPSAIGVTGVSYGGIQSLNLARLRNRVRLARRLVRPVDEPGRHAARDRGRLRALGRLRPRVRPPAERPLPRLPDARAEPEHPARRRDEEELRRRRSTRAATLTGFIAPAGGPFSSDLTTWRELADRGEPARGDALDVGRELTGFHSWAGLSGPSPPLLVQNGWTDDLFPAPEALRVYRTFTAAPGARISLQLGDLGHPRGQNKAQRGRRDAERGGALLRRVPEAPGQPAGARQRPRVHADLSRPARGRRPDPRGELGAAASADR